MGQIVSLTLPILISGLALIIAIKFKLLEFLDVPIDHGFLLNRKRLFGENKTYRGLAVFTIVAIFVCTLLQNLYFNNFQEVIHPIFKNSPILIGIVYALAYTFGELVNSAVKRQAHISPGKTTRSSFRSLQRFLDLSDGIVMVAFVLTLFTLVTPGQAFLASILGIGIHLGTDKLMQSLKLKQDF